ncbi:accessory Sec system protein translocase subunit SecY2 [Streptococcus pluranimalium]|uniref:accessory Sec system protein translocase subunit SecY2 n=1 Tax=Streptococcus pluranimalium TaxID=82348 RepID=UPI003F68E560
MKRFLMKHSFTRKVLVTLFFLLVFLVGRNVPIPNVAIDAFLFSEESSLGLGAAVTGGNLSQISLFSLGLGPWMYAMILSRVFNLGKKNDQSTSKKTQDRRHSTIMLIIAIIQALGIAISLDYQKSSIPKLELIFMTSLILIAGAFILVWIGNRISDKGIGGPSILVLVNILLSQESLFKEVITFFENREFILILWLIAWSLLAIFLMVLFEKAEYRIPVKRIGINNSLSEDTYMPIKINTAGGMPVMYAFSLLMLPQYLILLLTYLYPDNPAWKKLTSFFAITSLSGVLLYMLIIFILTLSFAYMNFDTVKTAENMRKSGDYIASLRPGATTKTYLSKIVGRLGVFSGCVMSFLASLPLLYALNDPSSQRIAMLTGIGMMIAGILLNLIDEIKISRLSKQYQTLFE